MTKLRNLLIAAIAIVGLSTSAWAGTATIGVVTSMMEVNASGTETDTLTAGGADVADTSVRNKSISDDVFTGSIFAEYTFDYSWALTAGVEVTPGKADVGGNFSRNDIETSISNSTLTQTNSVTRTAEATAGGFGTAYIEAPLFAGLYVRAGMSKMSVDYTTTTTGTQSGSYTDSIDLTGTNLGVGIKGNRDGYVYKLAYEQTDYDTFSLRSAGNSVAANSNGVKGDLDTKGVRLSIGKTF